MRVLVCGSRRWNDRATIARRMFKLPPSDETVVVHGAARGADRIAEQEAQKCGLAVEAHPADWEKHGKKAGVLRNLEMLDSGIDRVIAFWDGRSTGTQHTIEEAHKRGIPVEIIWKYEASGSVPSP